MTKSSYTTPRALSRRLTVFFSAAMVIGCVLVQSSASAAVLSSGDLHLKYQYTSNSCANNSPVDPINVVWYGPGATAKSIASKLRARGWADSDSEGIPDRIGAAGRQVIYNTSGGCSYEKYQRATKNFASNRAHVRIFATTDDKGNAATVGDAHTDTIIVGNDDCDKTSFLGVDFGHIGDFNPGRDKLSETWTKYNYQANEFWGNTNVIKQCNGAMRKSNGYLLFINTNPIAHSAADDDEPPAIPGYDGVAAPTISGTPRPGFKLTAQPGTWEPSASSVVYEWCHVEMAEGKCVPYPGATGSSWVPAQGNVGSTVGALVRPSNANPNEAVLSEIVQILPGIPPTVTTDAASEVGVTTAKLNGSVTPNGTSTNYYYQYGTTTSYGSTIPAPPGMNIGSGWSYVYTWNNVSGLQPATTYHFRNVATNAGGTSYGVDREFTTFSYGTPAAILDQADDQQWVHSSDPLTGNLRHANWKSTTGWNTISLGSPVRLGTTPAATFDDGDKQQWVFYVHTNGDIGVWNWKGTTSWQPYGLTAPKQVAPGTNPVAVLDQTDNQQWVWWVDTSGILNYWNWKASTGWINYSMGTAVAPGTSPTVSFNQATKEQSVFYVKPDMSIGQWRWTSSQPWHQGGLGGPVRANTSPTALYDQKTGQQWVFYVKPNGDIGYWNLPPGAGAWNGYTLAGPVRANTNLSVAYDPSDSQTWLWHVHPNGDIVYWNWKSPGGWQRYSLTGPGPVSPGTSLAPTLDLKTKQQWVHYRNAGGENSYWNWTSSLGWKHYGS